MEGRTCAPEPVLPVWGWEGRESGPCCHGLPLPLARLATACHSARTAESGRSLPVVGSVPGHALCQVISRPPLTQSSCISSPWGVTRLLGELTPSRPPQSLCSLFIPPVLAAPSASQASGWPRFRHCDTFLAACRCWQAVGSPSNPWTTAFHER